MKNIKELRNELVSIFNDLKWGKIEIKKAKEMTNTAGKILKSCQVELQYNEFMQNKIAIDFLEAEAK